MLNEVQKCIGKWVLMGTKQLHNYLSCKYRLNSFIWKDVEPSRFRYINYQSNYICDLNVPTCTYCTFGKEAFTSCSHITELNYLAKNSLRCFYTRSFWNCTVPLKGSHLQHFQHGNYVCNLKEKHQSRTHCTMHNLAKSYDAVG